VAHERALASPVAPHQGHKLPCANGEIDAVEHFGLARIAEMHTLDLDGGDVTIAAVRAEVGPESSGQEQPRLDEGRFLFGKGFPGHRGGHLPIR